MTNGGIIKHKDSGNFLITFSNSDFKEFIGSLASSTREEKYSLDVGFDLDKSKLRTFLDRIDHQISTQNNVVSKDFVFTCNIPDGREITVHNYENFFGIDDTSNEIAERLTVTVTYMIGFNRGDTQKYERQVIFFEFLTRPVGTVSIRIMSTEITWPPTIFQLADREVRALSAVTTKNISSEYQPLKWIISLMMSSREERRGDSINSDNTRRSGTVTRITVLVMTTIQMMMLFFLSQYRSWRPMYNEQTGLFERASFQTYVDRLGLDAAILHAEKSKVLFDLGYADFAPGQGTLGFAMQRLGDVLPIWGAIIGLLVGVTALYCRRMAKFYELASAGRIFLGNRIGHPREKVPALTGAAEAIMYSVIATAFMGLWQSFMQFLSY